jgi:hypothetical protein
LSRGVEGSGFVEGCARVVDDCGRERERERDVREREREMSERREGEDKTEKDIGS